MSREFELWQKSDGTLFKRIGEQWFYLSPLFGEWLPVWDRMIGNEKEDLKPYPRAIPQLPP